MLNVLDLFSGIGGFSLGLERTGGFRTIGFCESDAYARKVLAKHWPGIPCYPDIRTFGSAGLAADGVGPVDVITGGFPCQDISAAGKGAGLSGERSGLWFEMHRVIEEIHPRWVIIENVPVLRSRGLDTVLGGLAAIGYDAEWHCIPAAAIGAAHIRDRVWIIAYPQHPDADGERPHRAQMHQQAVTAQLSNEQVCDAGPVRADVADADGTGLAQRESQRGDARAKLTTLEQTDWWLVEPDVGRVADGISNRVHRIRCLGNAIVPQIAEAIGWAILSAEGFLN